MSLDNDDDEYHRYRYRDPSAPKNPQKAPSICCTKRLYVAILLFVGYLLHGIICQGNIIIIEAMTTDRINSTGNQTIIIQRKEFERDSRIEESILTMFHTGFLFSLLGGLLAHKYGGATTFGVSMLLTGSILLLFPEAIRTHFYLFLLSEALIGVLQGFCLVSTAEIYACWIPKLERTAVMFYVTSGMYFGVTIVLCFSQFYAFLITLVPWSIYTSVTGLVCIIWSVIWLISVKNEPLSDQRISEKELIYILQQTNTIMKKRDLQAFKDIVLSPPCWALFTAKFGLGWASAFAIAYLPLNLVKDLTFNLEQIKTTQSKTLVSSIPIINAVTVLLFIFTGWQFASEQRKSFVKPTTLYKCMLGGCFIYATIFFITFALFLDNQYFFIICFMVIKWMLSYNHVILETLAINMAPNHTSILSGLSLFWQSVGTVFVQTVIRFTVPNHNLEDWQFYFYSSAATLILCVIVFTFLGSSKTQPWSTIRHRDNEEYKNTRNTELINISTNS